MADLSSLRILICNDDGINAPGLALLEKLVATITPDVWVCAPETEQSASSHSLTLFRPVRLKKYGERRYSVDGTPTDCIVLGSDHLFPDRKPDLVISGINAGRNIADDITYSGTVAAAIEATLLGIPAIAFSQEIGDWSRGPRWHVAEQHLVEVLTRIMEHTIPPNVLFNVNFPDLEPGEKITGIQAVRQGKHRVLTDLSHRTDPHGKSYFWIGGIIGLGEAPLDTDISVLRGGAISVTPLTLDMTHHATLDTLGKAFA